MRLSAEGFSASLAAVLGAGSVDVFRCGLLIIKASSL
jgi:hypothetical protein